MMSCLFSDGFSVVYASCCFAFVVALLFCSATRTLKITGSSLGRYGGTHVQSSDSHSAVREKIIQSEDVAPGQKLFSFGPASTAATLVQACAFLVRWFVPC
jgi:hypothetical protein